MIVHVDEALCKGCGICARRCPKDVLAITARVNRKGYSVAGVVYAERCTRCRLCEIYCPDFAIYVDKERPSDSLTKLNKPSQEP